MKKYLLLTICAFIMCACYKEDKITPSLIGGAADKFDFPQEGTPVDVQAVLDEIYEDYGVKVIYKDFTSMDLNRAWLSPTTGVGSEITWEYITDNDKLLEAVTTLRDKVFGLLPAEIMKPALKAFPYIYLLDNLQQHTRVLGGGTVTTAYAIYPTRALDGMAVNLQLDAEPDNYLYKVYFPVYIAGEFFNQAFYLGNITLSKTLFVDVMSDAMRAGMWSYNWTNDGMPSHNGVASSPEMYWARQGWVPRINTVSGIPQVSKGSTHTASPGRAPLTGTWAEVPETFIYLCVDRNWRTFDDEEGVANDGTLTGVFYDCPKLIERLELFTSEMAAQGIDFEEIQEKLYAGTTITTYPATTTLNTTTTP